MRRQVSDDRYQKLIANRSALSPIVEEYRTLRINIQFTSIEKEIKTLLVTSTGSAEGKTVTGANLAIMMARDNKSTVFIDSDLRRPKAHSAFNLPNLYGVSSYLIGDSNLSEIIQESAVPKLSIITSGPIPPNPVELLGSKQMNLLIDELTQMFDVVIFDSPPLIITDALVLATKVDGCILVVDAKKTKRDPAVKAIEQLRNVNANILGAVLNNKRVKKKADYYTYA